MNNMIAPSLLNPVAVNIMKTFPVTNDPCGRTLYALVADQDENQYVAKMDWQISDKNSLFGRFMLGDLNQGRHTTEKTRFRSAAMASTTSIMGSLWEIPICSAPTSSAPSDLGANRTNVVKIPDNYLCWPNFGASHSTSRKYYRDLR